MADSVGDQQPARFVSSTYLQSRDDSNGSNNKVRPDSALKRDRCNKVVRSKQGSLRAKHPRIITIPDLRREYKLGDSIRSSSHRNDEKPPLKKATKAVNTIEKRDCVVQLHQNWRNAWSSQSPGKAMEAANTLDKQDFAVRMPQIWRSEWSLSWYAATLQNNKNTWKRHRSESMSNISRRCTITSTKNVSSAVPYIVALISSQ